MLSSIATLLLLAAGSMAEQGRLPNTRMFVAPADVLRDGPTGHCFASTLCEFRFHGDEWDLTPQHCGVSTCWIPFFANTSFERSATLQFAYNTNEVIEDCAPPVDESCVPDTTAAAPAADAKFPDCCPKYKCREGVSLAFRYDGPATGEELPLDEAAPVDAAPGSPVDTPAAAVPPVPTPTA